MLRVCLWANLVSGGGGVEQVIIGLATGLSRLTDGDEEYVFLAYSDSDEWLRPFVSGPCRIVHTSPMPEASRVQRARLRLRRAAPWLHDLWGRLPPWPGFRPPLPQPSDGFIERLGADIMHFTTPQGFLTKVPTIYHPHDLQHVHLPQFFTKRARWGRDQFYRILCEQATMVAIGASWGKRDLIAHFGLPPDRVCVVPLAPVTTAYQTPSQEEMSRVKAKFNLPAAFAVYPAQTWPHKNHLRLLDALARLRDVDHLTVPLVCPGGIQPFHTRIEHRMQQLGLENQVRFLGFVSTLELQCLYRLARCAVIPTLFEAASFPVWEAFLAGVPVACSNVTSLPEQVGDAALTFNPNDAADMAGAVKRLWTDDELCRTLVARAKTNVGRLTWERTARLFRAHYRRIAGRTLGADDQALLDAPPLL